MYCETMVDFEQWFKKELASFWLVPLYALTFSRRRVVELLSKLGICPGPDDWMDDYWDNNNAEGSPRKAWEAILDWYES